MRKITLTKFALLGIFLFFITGCQRPSENVDRQNKENPIQVEILSPLSGNELFLNGVFDVIRSDELINNQSKSIVVLRRLGSHGNLLLNICTPYRLKQDGTYALTGWVRRANACPGFELIGTDDRPGAVLAGLEDCTTEPNLDPVFLLPKRDTFFKRCEDFSLASDPREMHGNCKSGLKQSMFDSFGLVKCGNQIAPRTD